MKRKLATLLICVTALIGGSITAFASDITEINQESTSNKATINVTANVVETYKVTAPKNVVIGNTKQYTKADAFTVTGNLAGNRKLVLTVPGSVSLTQSGKDSKTGTVTTSKTEFRFDELVNNTAVNSSLTVDVSDITAGIWNGSFEISVALDDIQ